MYSTSKSVNRADDFSMFVKPNNLLVFPPPKFDVHVGVFYFWVVVAKKHSCIICNAESVNKLVWLILHSTEYQINVMCESLVQVLLSHQQLYQNEI